MEKSNTLFSIPTSILIGSVIIAIAILISGGVIKLKGGAVKSATVTNPKVESSPAAADQGDEEDTGPVKVSFDDDPVLGDKNAKVTIVEFSDYECPFCKRYFDQTFPEIKKDYIDSGKVKIVYRDLPLPFHDPMATKEAIAANCAREQGGDTVYFKYHDELFKRTTSNGNGLNDEDLTKIADDLGLNSPNLKTCVTDEKYKDEIQKDLTDANNYGASGTPTFFIGVSGDKEIEGTKLVGAQPYAAFKTLIDQKLAE